jgi:hypothetical protein
MSDARNVFLEAGDFATTHCVECRRQVLTYPDGGHPTENRARRCLHCDTLAAGELRWVDVSDLAALGYGVDSGEDSGGGCKACANSCAIGTVGGRRGE